ncbi:MAG: hypothetical protein QOI01_2057, partial [Mycobacterium sp.]|nr:hypothetical protein [Mycobacterium sp.]
MTAFHDLDDFLALPRVSGLAVSPDGLRVVTTISELNEKRTEFVTSVWELDAAGEQPARRLTRGAKGESSPVFTADGDLLFVAAREVPGSSGEDEPKASLWRLPAAGGEAVSVLELAGGVSAAHAAREADVTLVTAELLPSANGVDDDKRLRALRKDNKISALLHTGYPVRHWDHDLGPAQPHLLALAGGLERSASGSDSGVRDLTPSPGGGLREAGVDVSADGRFVVTSWAVPGPDASIRETLVRVDVATGEHTTIAQDPSADLGSPVISPDGRAVAFIRETHSSPERAPRITLCCMEFGESFGEVAADWDRWPTSVAWTVDGSNLIVTADEAGRRPVFVIDPETLSVSRLTVDDLSYTDVCAAPGGVVYALRSSYSAPPHPVRI